MDPSPETDGGGTPGALAGARNWLLTIAYDGSDFAGWQKQPDKPTVQGMLDHRLEGLFQAPAVTYATSRTDAGVHALGQRVTFHPPDMPPIPQDRIAGALNSGLPPTIRVSAVEAMPEGFHARFNALGKAYVYLLHRGYAPSPFTGRYMWAIQRPLDVAAMRRAAGTLAGTHDFTAFGATSRNGDNERDPNKTIHGCVVDELGPIVMVTVIGNNFLYRMVRRLTGFLVSVGYGRLPADAALELFRTGNRNAGFDTAPPHGLFLDRVFYDEPSMLAYRRTTLPFLDGLTLS